MRRCFELARNGEGRVAPNPMEGAIIVHEGRIIGEGYHTQYGAPHAEVMAVNSVIDKSLLPCSTIYVSLEPCCHYGKTPPCSQLILDMGIPKAIIAATDPFPKVSGGGIKQLKDNGVEVVVGILENEARELNRFFYTYHQKKRPYIIIKWAESIDGFIDSERAANEPPAKITGLTSNTLVHRWRTQIQSIMAGTNTVIRDNPQLTSRYWTGKNPLRITFDRNGRIPVNSAIFNDAADTLLFVPQINNNEYGDRTSQILVDFENNTEESVLKELYNRQIQSVFIEGGAQLINSFIKKDLWDEIRIFTGNIYLNEGVKAPAKPNVSPVTHSDIGNDNLLVYRKNNL